MKRVLMFGSFWNSHIHSCYGEKTEAQLHTATFTDLGTSTQDELGVVG